MTANEIRQQFLDFFAGKQHEIVASSPVVPLDDPTLMFANAGMNQFKDVFLGTGSRPYTRAADTQKCIRAGGKHNDLDDVGQDTYHHTFFEMLGNWSFGDYFKQEAIEWAWELLTKVWGIDKTRLHATYFEGDAAEGLEPDSEAAEIWASMPGMSPDRIHPGNKKDNFWEMGDTGPCGPCSEVHIDLTPDQSGGPLVNAGDARVIEIWNLVFIQFNRGGDKRLTPLPAKHVDTGMGFERVAAILQHKTSNYDTDVWTPLFDAIQRCTGAPAYTGLLPDQEEAKSQRDQLMVDISYRVIADHIRCVAFALTDGAVPSNEGRGYVLRRILRRAVRYGRQYFNMDKPFLCDLVEPLAAHMGGAFPELHEAHGGKNVQHVSELFRDEEESFGRTLDRGMKLFADAAEHARTHHRGRVSGEDAFKLHDTYGFPIDLTEQMAEENELTVDFGEYERLMEAAREKARAATKIDHPELAGEVSHFGRTTFRGYTDMQAQATVKGVLVDEKLEENATMNTGDTGALVLAETPFYAKAGGQVGDRGRIEAADGSWVFRVTDTQKVDRTYVHFGRCEQGSIDGAQVSADGTAVHAVVEEYARIPTMQNHTATHILNFALREVLGAGVNQKGSLVDAEKTRFDFSHNSAMTDEQLAKVQDIVNLTIEADMPVYTQEVEQSKAREINTLRAVFGERYPDVVRVVSIGAPIDDMLSDPKRDDWMQYSVEFCGGTHLQRSSEAQRFILTSEEAVAKGVRRVVGVSGHHATCVETEGRALLNRATELDTAVDDLAEQLAALQQELSERELPVTIRHQVRDRLAALQKEAKAKAKEQAAASGGAVMDRVASLLAKAETIGGVTVVVGDVPSAQANAMRDAIDWIRNKSESSAVFLAMPADGGKVTLIAGMSKDVIGKGAKAGDLIREIAPVVGGKGGGRPDMAQGGGTDASKIPAALEKAKEWIAGKVG